MFVVQSLNTGAITCRAYLLEISNKYLTINLLLSFVFWDKSVLYVIEKYLIYYNYSTVIHTHIISYTYTHTFFVIIYLIWLKTLVCTPFHNVNNLQVPSTTFRQHLSNDRKNLVCHILCSGNIIDR